MPSKAMAAGNPYTAKVWKGKTIGFVVTFDISRQV